MKDSFILFLKIDEILCELNNEQKGKLFQAIIDYQKTGEKPVFDDPEVKIAFIPIKQDLDLNNEKWVKTCEARSAAGKKSADVRRSKQKTTNDNKTDFVKNEITKSTDYENDNENENDKKNITPKSPKGEKGFDELIAEKGFSPRIEEIIKQWLEYKKEKNNKYKRQGLLSLLTTFKNRVETYGEDAVINIVLESMGSNYQGILWTKLDKLPKMVRPAESPPGREPPVEEPEETDEEWAAAVAAADW